MKCECKEYCDGNEATMKCRDCGKKYCEECASAKEFLCECSTPQNIINLDSSNKNKTR